jgi:hypothetical protein
MHPLNMANAPLTLNEHCHGCARLIVGAGGEWPGVMQVRYGRRIDDGAAVAFIDRCRRGREGQAGQQQEPGRQERRHVGGSSRLTGSA